MGKKKFLIIAFSGIIILFLSGCELSKYPLILDAAGKSKTIRIDANPSSTFSDSVIVSIEDLKELTDYDIDSIRFYNLTLHVTNDTSDANATFSGNVTVEGEQLLSLTNVQLSEFSRERSIFDKTIAGYTYNKSGVVFLLNALKTQNPSSIKLKVEGTAGNNELHFDLTITLYAQVFATP